MDPGTSLVFADCNGSGGEKGVDVIAQKRANRYEYLKEIADIVGNALVVTGPVVSSEWPYIHPSESNLRVRTLGLVSSMALGMAVGLPRRKVVALDGDGGLLMNLCSLPTIARQNPKNLIHVVFDNEVYDSSGGLQTATAYGTDLVAIAKDAGIRNSFWTDSLDGFRRLFGEAISKHEISFIGVKAGVGRGGIPPMKLRDAENKYQFIRHIEKTEGTNILETWTPSSYKKEMTEGFRIKPMADNLDPKASAKVILDAMKKAGINLICTLPDFHLVDLIRAIDEDPDVAHIPLCREEEGVGICAGAYLVGKKSALLIQNEGLLNSCNAISTTVIRQEIPFLLVIYYAGDIGDRGFTQAGNVTLPILDALRIRNYIMRRSDEIEWTFRNAQILAEDAEQPVAVLLTKDVLGLRA